MPALIQAVVRLDVGARPLNSGVISPCQWSEHLVCTAPVEEWVHSLAPFPRRVEVGGCPGSEVSPVMVNRLSQGMPPRKARRPHLKVVDKVPSEQGAPRSTLAWSRSSTAASGHLVHVETSCRSGQNWLSAVAPLRQWSQYRAMHLGKDLVDLATRASWRAFTHQESGCVAVARCVDITGRCSGTGIRGAHHMNLRPPAELRR
jgi:hypothetical protein